MFSSEYINTQRREYSLYVLQQRAIPHAADGLKAASRRVLWVSRDGKKYKSATLAGATMPIHPHAAPEGAINTLASPYTNNIPLLKGDGAFGTLLRPTAFGASRYTSVSVSQFTKDVVFRDIEVIPMQENYDGTLQEPIHFLPLVPLALLNPQDGIAVGFASSILPRSLENIIASQIEYLQKKKVHDVYPALIPTNQICEEWIENKDGSGRWVFKGSYEKVNAVTIKVTNLPYGTTHEKYDAFLSKLIDDGKIINYEDNSKDVFNIEVKFKKGTLSRMKPEEVEKLLGLVNAVPENLNVIDFDGQTVLNTDYVSLVSEFTKWRLKWYVDRYTKLKADLEIDIQRYKDILLAIKKNVGGIAKRIKTRKELKAFLDEIGVVYIDYIADLPIYRFTEEEKKKVEEKLKGALATLKHYNALLKSEDKRRVVYIDELKDILKNYRANKYDGVG